MANFFGSEEENLLQAPTKPFVERGDLTNECNEFLSKIFDLFSANRLEDSLDKGGLMSVMIAGYPMAEMFTLKNSVQNMFEMSGIDEDEYIGYDELLELNFKAAKENTDAFETMLQNMAHTYSEHIRANEFLERISNMGMPKIFEPLSLIIMNRENEQKDGEGQEEETIQEREPILVSMDLDGVVEKLKESQRIVIMAGAGISTSCGIPDFRTPGTGLYDNLQQYNLPEPTAVFDINFFRENPEPFFLLSKEIYPENFIPSPTHYFISLLSQKGLLQRHYSQNIDGLERLAGVPDELVVQAHGSYSSSTCLSCQKTYTYEETRELVFSDTIPRCTAEDCSGLVKPDITFFGEGLPERFGQTIGEDFAACDLLFVIGTSLMVAPFNGLMNKPNENCPRILMNMEKVGEADENPQVRQLLDMFRPMFEAKYGDFFELYGKSLTTRIEGAALGAGAGFVFTPNVKTYRDVFLQGPCDETVMEIIEKMGWENEFNELMESTNAGLAEMRARRGQES